MIQVWKNVSKKLFASIIAILFQSIGECKVLIWKASRKSVYYSLAELYSKLYTVKHLLTFGLQLSIPEINTFIIEICFYLYHERTASF